ncbi:MAG: hypothetical protein OHK0053_38200 [Microscillaceae bacterium]
MKLADRYEYDPQTDRLGKGGFGSVFKAYDHLAQREVALKFVPTGKLPDRYGLREEMARLKALHHPNIVRYYDFLTKTHQNLAGETEEVEIGVMEYVNGGDLGAFMKMGRARQPEILRLLFEGILAGLAYLHTHKIIHRDIKPQNILLQVESPHLIPKIGDFSLSKQLTTELTSVSAAVGTYEYMSPEQLGRQDTRLGPGTDLWSFGVLAYQLLTGQLPFGSRRQGDSDGQIIANILNPHFPVDFALLPESYRQVVERCLQPEPTQRWPSVEALRAYWLREAEKETIALPPLPQADAPEADPHLTAVPEAEPHTQTHFSPKIPPLTQTIADEKIPVAAPAPMPDPLLLPPGRKHRSTPWAWFGGLLVVLLLAIWGAAQWTPKTRKTILPDTTAPAQDLKRENRTNLESAQQAPALYPQNPPPSSPQNKPEAPGPVSAEASSESEVNLPEPNPAPTPGPNPTPPARPDSPERYEYEEGGRLGKIVMKGNKYGFLDPSGRLLVPLQYDDFAYPQEGMAAVKKGLKWGYINLQNQVLIPFRYDRPGVFRNGQANVSIGSHDFTIDRQGNCMANCL